MGCQSLGAQTGTPVFKMLWIHHWNLRLFQSKYYVFQLRYRIFQKHVKTVSYKIHFTSTKIVTLHLLGTQLMTQVSQNKVKRTFKSIKRIKTELKGIKFNSTLSFK